MRVTLSPADRVAVIAGSGRLPVNVAQQLAAAGHEPFIVLAGGEADAADDYASFDSQTLAVEEIGGLVPLLKRQRVTHVVLAGGIGRRPDWRKIKLGLGTIKLLPALVAKLSKGDNAVLSALVAHIEAQGIRVVGAHEIVPDLVAPQGVLGRVKPNAADRADLKVAAAAARTIGALDIGQAVVAIGGRVVAVEGIEGTDGLLSRVAEMRSHGRIAMHRRGVLVKCAKPDQELRADLPTIGPATVEAAHAAGLAGIGVEAGRSLILDQARAIERADALGLFVIGLTPEDAGGQR